MKNLIQNKKIYSSPHIETISLDYDISLILESAPPVGPDESLNTKPDYFSIDPFKLKV